LSTQPADQIAEPGAALASAPLHIVLVEPEIPPNTGNVARLCAATGCALHLVEPLGFSIGDRDLKRAGLDYWDAVTLCVHRSLAEFRASIGERRIWLVETDGTRTYREVEFARGDILVFGKETTGLPQRLLDDYRRCILRVPIRGGRVRSLNLSTTVGIVAYEALAQLGFPGLDA
jgi:tRNA (cytidine/uridine-2'-O-)-methyltransferase